MRPWMLLPASLAAAFGLTAGAEARTVKPVLHGRHWVAITGKPLGATAGAMIFQKGGNAVDAACAMLAATATMHDTLGWGGETQALIYDPRDGRVRGINALGVAPTGATPEFFRARGMAYPPEYGPLAAVTPGTPGGLLVILKEFGTLSLEEVLGPALQMAEGYPIEREAADAIERHRDRLREWPYSRALFLVHPGEEREAPHTGEVFRQPDLLATLKRLVEAERRALAAGKGREQAIQAAYDEFYRGGIAEEFVRGAREQGALITREDLANWKVHVEEPVKTEYKGIEVYKLTTWVQGPVLLQALNILENADLSAMGYNSAEYVHAVYQAMNLAFADRDFYYGDPYFPPEEPIRGLLSKDYARQRFLEIDWKRNDPDAGPGDPYPFEGKENPFRRLLEGWTTPPPARAPGGRDPAAGLPSGTTTVLAADAAGWVVSMTPSGGWIPAVVAGRTGIPMSQRMQSFIFDEAENPFNVVEPGKRPRATLTPSLALREGRPFLAFAVQGGDTQDQNLLQFFLNVVEFGMNVQEAAEAPNFNSYQMRDSFRDHGSDPGRLTLNAATPARVRRELKRMGYRLDFRPITSGPINAVWFDRDHGTLWGGSSHHGEDYGVAW